MYLVQFYYRINQPKPKLYLVQFYYIINQPKPIRIYLVQFYYRINQPKPEIYLVQFNYRINQSELRFFEAVCMKSAFIIQRPEKLFVHTTDLDLSGGYWDTLKKIPGFKEALVVKRIIEPDQIHGVQFYWTAHKVIHPILLKLAFECQN